MTLEAEMETFPWRPSGGQDVPPLAQQDGNTLHMIDRIIQLTMMPGMMIKAPWDPILNQLSFAQLNIFHYFENVIFDYIFIIDSKGITIQTHWDVFLMIV